MCSLWNYITSAEAIPIYFQKYLGEPDYRVKNWILLNSSFNLLGIYLAYTAFLLVGKWAMKNRKPLNLKNALVAYNCFQTAFNAFICKEIFVSAYLAEYKLSCTPLERSSNLLALRMATAFWYYFISKVIDLGDTVFFVLRKKTNQLTFLHIYHHISMIFNWYIGVLYVPGGQAFFSVGVNSFVHVLMYTYYLLSSMGPAMQKHLWWKKYLTQIQLIQFIVIMIHLIYGYMNGCRKPKWLICFTVTYVWTLVILFANFYFQAYKLKKLKMKNTNISTVCDKRNKIEDNLHIDIKAGGDRKLD